jgi:Arc/MetJ family transcription regulator
VPSNLALDDELLEAAWQIGGLKTKRETVNLALAEFVRRRRAPELVELFGTIPYDPDYDYKKARERT